MKNHKQNQSEISLKGRALEKKVMADWQRVFDKAELNFIVKFHYKFNYNGLTAATCTEPDITVWDGDLCRLVIGVKSSFRERWAEDAFINVLMLRRFPELLWVEVYDLEHPDDTLQQLRTFAATIANKGFFTECYSIRDRAEEQRIQKAILAQLLAK